MKDKLKWTQVMDLVQKVEDKYGSIKDTPISDPDFKKLKDLCAITHGNHLNTLTRVSAEKQCNILNKIVEGYTKTYIRNLYHVSDFTVDQVATAHGVQIIPPFAYILHKDGEKDFYFRSKLKDASKFFHHYFVSGRKLKAYLDKNGWSLICKKTIWGSIPIGAQYISKSKANILTKTTMRFEEV